MDDHKRYYDPRDLWPMLVDAGLQPSEIRIRRHKFGLNTFAVCRVPRDRWREPSSSAAPGSSAATSSTRCSPTSATERVTVYDNFTSGREWHLAEHADDDRARASSAATPTTSRR